MNELITQLIRKQGYNPDTLVGLRTVFEIVESHILGAFDEIDEYEDEQRRDDE